MTISEVSPLPYQFKNAKICCDGGTFPVHSILMTVHSNFLTEVLVTIPSDVQQVFILPDFSIKDIKTLCAVMYGNVKKGYVDACLLKTLGFLKQRTFGLVDGGQNNSVSVRGAFKKDNKN